MKSLLKILVFLIICTGVKAQTPSGTKTRTPGVWISSKDTANATSADSIVILANRADSSLRFRFSNTAPWRKILFSNGTGDFISNQIGNNLSVQTGKFWISDTGYSSRLFRAPKFYGDTLQATGSGGGVISTNGGSTVIDWGGGGSVQASFHGFAGYNANRSSSYTVRSFTDKNYVDSTDALRVKYTDTASMFTNYLKKDFAGVTGTLPVANGGTGANSFTANRFLLGNGTSAITTNASINYDGTYVNLPAVSAGGGFLTGGSSGGSGILFYNSNSSLVLRSAFDTLRLQGGQNNANKRPIAFYTGDASGYSAMFDENGLFMRGSTQSLSTNTNEYATTSFVKGQGYTSNTGTVTSVGVSGANGIGVSGSPVTTSGTISLSLGNITPSSISASGNVTVTGNTAIGTYDGGVQIPVQSGYALTIGEGTAGSGKSIYSANGIESVGLVTASGGVKINGGVFAASTLYTSAANGLLIAAKTGSANDFFLLTPAGGTIFNVPTGTNNVTFASLGTGTVYSNAGTLTNTNPSDSLLKDSIKVLPYGLNEIIKLKPKTFYYKSDTAKASLKYGFLAQDVKSIMPDMVRKLNPKDPASKLGLETDGIYVTMVKAIQELKAENDNKQLQIDNLRYQLDEIKALLLKNNIK